MLAFHCRDCSLNNAYRSRTRSVFGTRAFAIVFASSGGCEHCFRRQYVTVLRRVPERPRHPEHCQSRRMAA
jgi:hypothetical protein